MKCDYRWTATFLLALAGPTLAQDGGRSLEPLNDPTDWITTLDYPVRAHSMGAEGIANYALTVATDGSVSDCEVTGGSAPDVLKTLTCELIQQRARFRPATDAEGKAVAGSYEGGIDWIIPEGDSQRNPDDPVQYPLSDGFMRTYVLSYVIEKDGSYSSCEFEGPPELADLEKICPKGKAKPPVSFSGEPLRVRITISHNVEGTVVD